MFVRIRSVEKLSLTEYRLALDVVDPGRMPWDYGDCVVQVDVLDTADNHESRPRGLLRPAFELYRLSPEDPPQQAEARLMWDIGKAVFGYVDHLFDGGVFCPFSDCHKEQAAERSDERSI